MCILWFVSVHVQGGIWRRGGWGGSDSLNTCDRVGVGTGEWLERGLNFSQVSTMRKRTVNKPDDA